MGLVSLFCQLGRCGLQDLLVLADFFELGKALLNLCADEGLGAFHATGGVASELEGCEFFASGEWHQLKRPDRLFFC